MLDKYQAKVYDGTLESARELIDNLLVKNDYKFDLRTKELVLFTRGILYRPGDTYTYLLPNPKFEAIG